MLHFNSSIGENTMTNTVSAANEALASLGLTGVTAEVPEVAATAEVEQAAPATEAEAVSAEAEEETGFESGEISDLSFDEVPAQVRGFANTSTKYGFEHIKAPGTDGKKYHGKLVEYKDGDVTKFKRSVQSGATGQNSKAEKAGAPNYYITRTAEKDGKFLGMYIIRTDERPVQAEEAAEASAE